MRNECIRTIEELALTDPKVVVIASDPAADYMPELAQKHPERLLIEGVCEQALAGMAAGMASEGYYPYLITLAVFATRRCYEQLLLDFGMHHLSGCIVGTGGGLTYSLMGPTHIAVDDLALIGSIPGSAIFSPGEPAEAIALTKSARRFKGLSYMRLAGTTEALSHAQGSIDLGKGRVFKTPGEVLFIACGAATFAVQDAVSLLKQFGIEAGILHLHTVKPLDVDLVRRCAKDVKVILCVEEHRQIGGLSSAVLHALTSAEPAVMPTRFASIGVDDTFPFGYGAYEDHMNHYGITGVKLAERARELLSHAGADLPRHQTPLRAAQEA